jgi:hypothetical protein
MNDVNKHMNDINKHMNDINPKMYIITKCAYSCNSNYCDIEILGINNLLIKEKKNIEKHIGSLEFINNNILRFINFLNKKYYVINITHNNTINFIMQNKLQLKHLLDKLVVVYNDNLYNINLIKKKINIINLTTSMFTPFHKQ